MGAKVDPGLRTDPVSTEDLRQAQRVREETSRLPLLMVAYHKKGVTFAPLKLDTDTVVGRDADVSIPDPTLSRHHARFTNLQGKVTVEDLGSSNGTWVDAQRVNRTELRVGKEVRLGAVIVLIHAIPANGASERIDKQRIENELERLLTKAIQQWSLTRRQSEVLKLVILGKTNKEIACQLGCREGTVEVYVSQLLKKSNTGNRTELTSRVWSLEDGVQD